jgi:hypothetical protein
MSGFAYDFIDLCPQQVVWNPLSGRDNYGKPTYGPPQYFPGRRVYKASRVASYERGTKGQGPEVISESQIWILGTPAINYEDQVFIQGDNVNTLPPVLSWSNYPDEVGPTFVKVYLGSSNG